MNLGLMGFAPMGCIVPFFFERAYAKHVVLHVFYTDHSFVLFDDF